MLLSRPFLPFLGIFHNPRFLKTNHIFFAKPLTIPPQTLDTIDIIDEIDIIDTIKTIGTIKTIYYTVRD